MKDHRGTGGFERIFIRVLIRKRKKRRANPAKSKGTWTWLDQLGKGYRSHQSNL
ncbi:hypothetical protein HYC85_023722 [Camellia sinensis]|uniref:Uncharacterized protein n=1 Tax=Camellia sinensis TaxID=4442 RepID=A0A7J7GFC3_CAMSI|nr:hypothetical protein HYC85_023722 [Camellia sinensis]